MKNWLKALLSETILSIRLVAHLSFFERWDSTSLSRLRSMDSADAQPGLVFQWAPAKMRRKPGAAWSSAPTFAKNKGAKATQPLP